MKKYLIRAHLFNNYCESSYFTEIIEAENKKEATELFLQKFGQDIAIDDIKESFEINNTVENNDIIDKSVDYINERLELKHQQLMQTASLFYISAINNIDKSNSFGIFILGYTKSNAIEDFFYSTRGEYTVEKIEEVTETNIINFDIKNCIDLQKLAYMYPCVEFINIVNNIKDFNFNEKIDLNKFKAVIESFYAIPNENELKNILNHLIDKYNVKKIEEEKKEEKWRKLDPFYICNDDIGCGCVIFPAFIIIIFLIIMLAKCCIMLG